MNTGIDKRRHPRIPINLPVSLMTRRGVVNGQTSNLSLGGMSITLPDEIPDKDNELQATIEMAFDLEIQLACAIKWSENINNTESSYSETGVCFTKILPSNLELIDSMIAEYSGS